MNRNRDDAFKTIFEKFIDATLRPEFANAVALNKLEDKLAETRFIKLDQEGQGSGVRRKKILP